MASGQTARLCAKHLKPLCAEVAPSPDRRAAAPRDHLEEPGRVNLSRPTVSRALRRLGLSRKKTAAASERHPYKRAWYRRRVAVLDNPSVQKASRIERVAEARGARAPWVAPYSPDFGPIEQCWSKVKSLLRAAKARRREELGRALAYAIDQVTRTDIRGWFKHCGYKVASA